MILIVGAGLSGATIAEHYARKGTPVLLIDKRDHIGGNIYDYTTHGIRISKYGAHLFHTDDDEVWNYVNRFGEWKRYDHSVIANVKNNYVPIPVNITTVNTLCNTNIKNENEMKDWLIENQIHNNKELKNSEDVALSRVGKHLYELLFKQYTIKQWDKDPSELDASVLSRIPVRSNFDNRYFNDKYQALPVEGYTSIIKNMIDHPLITLKLNYSWETAKHEIKWSKLIFTGPIDLYFNDIHLPKLEYRSIDFKWEIYENKGFYQQNSVINFPLDNVSYTRCIEYKHFLHQKSDYTIICKEFSSDNGDPYYPVPTKKNQELYEKYKQLAEIEPNVHFIGRLASYKYFNMDQAIRNAIDYFNTYLKDE